MARFGEIGKQYLDDSGDPLVSGKLYFYESGTTTNKDTYSDVNLAIVNTNPVILTAAGRQPNIFFDGTARVVLTDADEVQIEVRDPEGGDTSTGQFDEWNSLIVYSQYDIAQESGVAYQSLTNNNQGNTPSSSPSEWGVYVIDLINDTTPQLGGDLDVNGNDIPGFATDADILGKQTIYMPSAGMTAQTSAGAESGSVETTTNKVMIQTMDFDTAADEYVQFSVRMPKGWNESTVTAAFSWSHGATTTNFGVAWGIQAVAVSNDDALDVAFGTGVVTTDTGGTTDDLYITSDSSAITIGGTPAELDMVVFRVYRDVSDAGDTMAIDARLHGVSLYYTTDSATDD